MASIDRIDAVLTLRGSVLSVQHNQAGTWCKIVVASDGAYNIVVRVPSDKINGLSKGDIFEGAVRVGLDKDRESGVVRGWNLWGV